MSALRPIGEPVRAIRQSVVDSIMDDFGKTARELIETRLQLEQARQDLAYLREENRELRAELEDSMPTDMPV